MVDTLHLGLPEVALLAKVQRAPVSMWISRYAGSSTPFPGPAAVRGSQRLYDGEAVVRWLEDTGRGNNRTPRADLAAFAALADADPDTDEVTFAGVTALLCLGRYVDGLPVDHDDLLDEADAADPNDEFLYSEIETLGERLVPVARYSTMLVDAAFHAGAAFEQLMRRRDRRLPGGRARTAVAAPARELLAAVAIGLATEAEIPDPVYVDPAPGAGDLLVDLARAAGEDAPMSAAVPEGDTPDLRLARRRLRVHGVPCQTAPSDGDGGVVVPPHGIVVMQLPSPDRPDVGNTDVLRRIEDVVLGSPNDRRIVVIGRAGALTERLRGSAAEARDGILRTDRLRGIVRLPARLMPQETRTRLALWCIGPPSAPPGPPPQTLVADLPDVDLDEAVIAELVTDLVAGMQHVRGARAHEFRFARPVATRSLVARLDGLVDPAPTGPRRRPAVEVVARVAELERVLSTPLASPGRLNPVARSAPGGDPVTLGQAIQAGELRVHPGLRLDPHHVDESASVRVIGPAEVLGSPAVRRIDRLLLEAVYPASRFTEPGDVVFCTAPRPGALVDGHGGAVVEFPARVLRSRSARLPARVVAATVNAQLPRARAWRTWTVGTIPVDQVDALRAILDALDSHRDDLTRRLDAVAQLASTITDGTASGLLDLSPLD